MKVALQLGLAKQSHHEPLVQIGAGARLLFALMTRGFFAAVGTRRDDGLIAYTPEFVAEGLGNPHRARGQCSEEDR